MPPRWRPILSEIVPYVVPPPLDALAAELGQPVLRLSANENPLGPSPLAVAAIRRETERIHLYPDGGAPALAAAVAETLGISPRQLIFGNGGDEILTILARALLDPGDEVVVPDPSFEPYTHDGPARRRQGRDEPAPRLPDRPGRRPGAHRAAHQARVPVEPAQPDGDRARPGRLGSILRALPGRRRGAPRRGVRRLHRGARARRRRAGDAPDAARSLLLLRTFSKITGLAGLRVGYAIAGPDAIGYLERTREPFNVGRVAQAGAAAAMRDLAHREATRQVVWAERRALAAAFADRGLSHPPTEANFFLVRLGRPTGPVVAALRARGVLVRDGAAVGYPAHLRISVGTPEQNARLLDALDRALAG